MSATRPTFGALQFATSYAANLLLAHGDGASSGTIEWLHNNLRALLDAYDAAASSSSTPLSETPSEPIRACDYADKSPAHRDKPATRNVRGYRICEDCYVAMREAERQWDEAQVRASLAPLSEPTSEGT